MKKYYWKKWSKIRKNYSFLKPYLEKKYPTLRNLKAPWRKNLPRLHIFKSLNSISNGLNLILFKHKTCWSTILFIRKFFISDPSKSRDCIPRQQSER